MTQTTRVPGIRFYKVPDPWGLFSNFSRHPIIVDDLVWPSTEHYYQAQKFINTDPKWAELIRQEPKCGIAANMGRDRNHVMREGWDEISYHVMNVALFAKFTQHEDCKAVLLASDSAHLIEDTRQGRDDDHIWGDGSTGNGKNLLGKGLMRVRDGIREGQADEYLAEDAAKIG